jgi:plasmid stabilization system protein ParE
MDEGQEFEVIITSSAEKAYFHVLEYVYEHHAPKKAEKIALELLKFPLILKQFPKIGTLESILENRPEIFRFLVFERTEKITVKILYFVDYEQNVIYITDFFPSEMLNKKIKKRN